ncbi:TNF receptor-associated factor family protein DDB_G0272098 [Drosophila grimshawi]|uniref:TNF receptor-associated factor family protein DDB_G0272098 n=1 Tax=Drosophila grimshawi TaxID=7222 RepID=UPI0013EF146A|nr:TNF receptor-associated factor family protein DDB_G0272098 [Drosophila grimshawi]
MVSIPSANMNGGLKAANNNGTVVGVAGTVLTNAQRVYLTPASSYHLAARQSSVVGGAAATGVGMGVGVMATAIFSKLQQVQQLNASVGQRKLLNGDTMVLVNGSSKPLIFATPANKATTATIINTTATATTTVPNGNRVLINNQQQTQKQQLNKEQGEQDDQEEEQQQQQQQQHHEVLLPIVKGTDQDAEPELDIVINNVVCSFSVRCHLKLREIALNGSNVEYRRENGMVTMKLRRPYTTASIWSSGRITCTGATSELQAKIAARRYARCLGKLGFPTHFQHFRIVNVLGTCSMPWAIKIVNFSERHRDNASYEPELHPGVTYKMREPKATLKIFSTGSITVTAPTVNDVESAIQHIYPLVHEFRKQRSAEELQHLRQKQRNQTGEESNEDSLLVNNSAGQTTNANRPLGAGAGAGSNILTSAPINTMRRLEQATQYNEMLEQTQANRRHIPFTGDHNQHTKGNNNTTTANNISSSSNCNSSSSNNNNNSSSSNNTINTGDNICANARRRATECWATKLQNKRPRYNDPGVTAGTTNVGGGITVARTTSTSTTNPPATAAAGIFSGNNGAAAAAAVVVNKPNTQTNSKPLIPVDVVLKNSSSRARNAAAVVASSNSNMTMATTIIATTTTTRQQIIADDVCGTRTHTFSPTDFEVDDLIEEDDDDDMSIQF